MRIYMQNPGKKISFGVHKWQVIPATYNIVALELSDDPRKPSSIKENWKNLESFKRDLVPLLEYPSWL